MTQPETSDSWVGPVNSHGVWIDVDGPNVVLSAGSEDDPRYLVFDEAMDVAEVLGRAVGQATRNAVGGKRWQ